eukprot:1778480-Heterocapsa_arctica.AAC.1
MTEVAEIYGYVPQVAEYGYAPLRHASEKLKGDREFILQAVEREARALLDAAHKGYYKGSVLQYASLELKGDREFILQAVKLNSSALQYASLELRSDRKLISQA